MADDCWGAFGSDSESDDDIDVHQNESNSFESAADATALAITQQFVSSTKSSGVLLKERMVGIEAYSDGEQMEKWQEMVTERVLGRGMKIVVGGSDRNTSVGFHCDAAILLQNDDDRAGGVIPSSCITRDLLPGGFLWLIIPLQEGTASGSIQQMLEGWSEAIWDVESASLGYSSSDFQVISMRKRACVINSWSLIWMDKDRKIRSELSTMNEIDEFTISANDTYLDYERKVASEVTISPSAAERTRKILTDENVQRATEIMQRHGLVVIKGLLDSTQTIPWGEAVLSDFDSACSRLRCHPTRPVDLMNPHKTDSVSENITATEGRIFEPLSYKEMAMREDLRVDLRSGPEMETLRRSQNEIASHSMAQDAQENIAGSDMNDGPSMIDADCTGTVTSWRYHPSILAIIKNLFNPRDDTLYKGNFGRWNFGGNGPDGLPQPFRLGQIGSVLSCPGAGDQAIHADTPHLFEHVDCLPCHYLNVFTPGYNVINDPNNNCYQNEFVDGIWTGNSTMGGTALVHGSHKLSVTTQLLSEDDSDMSKNGNNGTNDDALLRRQLLQLRTLRPALDTGDVLIFDCRSIHYGLANTSQGDIKGKDINAGKRPMLYLNVSQSWFHDPKNWDTREKIWETL
ncbi:hypothetical protein ACHAXR_006439 [Thalassiosira sp. AJA248-18]